MANTSWSVWQLNTSLWFLGVLVWKSSGVNSAQLPVIDIQELCSDSPRGEQVNGRVYLEGQYNHKLEYHLPGDEEASVLYFLSKPAQLRYAEKNGDASIVTVHHSTTRSYIHFERLNFDHQGNYSLYRIEFEPDDHTRVLSLSRTDLTLVVQGLFGFLHRCNSNNQCESGTCNLGTCACKPENPIWAQFHCFPARNYNESCDVHEQCSFLGGKNAECFLKRCRCQKNSVKIKVSSGASHCVTMAQLHEPCYFSKQCILAGKNRYCNGTYHCDCLPGYPLVDGRVCSSAMLTKLSLILLVLVPLATLVTILPHST